jgi:hypothetical protein
MQTIQATQMKPPERSGLIAVDNSLNSPGIAVFDDGLLVASCALKSDPEYAELNIAERILRVASDVVEWAIQHTDEPHYLVYEWPQVYTAAKSKGDPNALLGVAAVGSAVSAILAMGALKHNIVVDAIAYKPAQWIGQLPKATTGRALNSPRAKRILSRLDDLERGFVSAKHDAIDAIGLGLFRLGRLQPERVFPGAT